MPTLNRKFTLQPGDYSIPFSFPIPKECPSSCEVRRGSDYGYTRYSIYCNIDIAWRFDPSARLPITILQQIPSGMPHHYPGRCDTKQKSVGCLCMQKSSAHFDTSIERMGYSPGEDVMVNCKGRAPMKPCKLHFKLIKVTQLACRTRSGPSITSEQTLG